MKSPGSLSITLCRLTSQANVRVPVPTHVELSKYANLADKITGRLMDDFNISATPFPYNDKLWIRIAGESWELSVSIAQIVGYMASTGDRCSAPTEPPLWRRYGKGERSMNLGCLETLWLNGICLLGWPSLPILRLPASWLTLAQIYNELSDYEKLAAALKEILADVDSLI